MITDIKELLVTIAAIITSVGIIAGAFWLIVRAFKSPDRITELEKQLDEVKKKIHSIEAFQDMTKVYYAGFKEDLTEVKDKVSRIEDLLLSYAKNN